MRETSPSAEKLTTATLTPHRSNRLRTDSSVKFRGLAYRDPEQGGIQDAPKFRGTVVFSMASGRTWCPAGNSRKNKTKNNIIEQNEFSIRVEHPHVNCLAAESHGTWQGIQTWKTTSHTRRLRHRRGRIYRVNAGTLLCLAR